MLTLISKTNLSFTKPKCNCGLTINNNKQNKKQKNKKTNTLKKTNKNTRK